MSQFDGHRDNGIPESDLTRIDQVCSRYEAAWDAGEEPDVEAFLYDSPDSILKALRQELKAIEIERRSQQPARSTLRQFTRALSHTGLMTVEDVATFCEDLPKQDRPTDAKQLAQLLVREKKLTAFQAHALYQRRSKGLVLGNYVIFDRIGAGGMGLIYKAQHRRMNRVVALKILPSHFSRMPEAVRRFQREVEAAARLSHPNIVVAHDADEADGTHFLVMEYVEGHNLADQVKQRGPLPIRESITYVLQVARGLQYAHEHGVIHRDIKPANLLLDNKGTIKILDMGLARLRNLSETDSPDPTELTHSGQMMGTCDYMAPEQIEDSRQAGRPADVYSLGCTLHRLLTDKPMYSGKSRGAILLAHREKQVPLLTDERPDVSPQLDLVYRHMVAKRPEDRFQSMDEVITALEACLPANPNGTFDEQVLTEPTRADAQLDTFLQGLSHAPSATHNQVISQNSKFRSSTTPIRKQTPPWRRLAQIAGGALLIIAVAVAVLDIIRRANIPGQQAKGRSDRTVSERPSHPRERHIPGIESQHTASEKDTASEAAVDHGEEPFGPVSPTPIEDESQGITTDPKPHSKSDDKVRSPSELAESSSENDATVQTPIEILAARRKVDEKYATAMAPVETQIATWAFAAARTASDSIHFDDPDLATRLENRREEIRLMEPLKQRLIRKINEANPPFTKKDLHIRGIGGEIVSADSDGIKSKTIAGEIEQLAWNEVGRQATNTLLEMIVDPAHGPDCLSAGLLAFSSGDPTTAFSYFDGATATGSDISMHRTAMANAMLAEANRRLLQSDFAAAVTIVEELMARCSDLPWLADNRKTIDAAHTAGHQGLREAEAEILYAAAVKQHQTQSLFDLRDTVQRLQREFSDCQPVVDVIRSPSIHDLTESVSDLGNRMTVRRDGTGDYTSIQEAINAAPPNSLVEIQDEGPYNEKLLVSPEKRGLTLRGSKGMWPVITSVGKRTSFPILLDAHADQTTFERLVLSHGGAAGGTRVCLNAGPEVNLSLRSVILFGGQGQAFEMNNGKSFDFRQCVIVGTTWRAGTFQMQDSIWIGIPAYFWNECRFDNCVITEGFECGSNEFSQCTLVGPVILTEKPGKFINCIVRSIEASQSGTTVRSCNVFDNVPFRDNATAGNGCINVDPHFLDPSTLDFRLAPTSACLNRGTDGGAMGCRYTAEMIQMLRLTHQLQAQGIVKF